MLPSSVRTTAFMMKLCLILTLMAPVVFAQETRWGRRSGRTRPPATPSAPLCVGIASEAERLNKLAELDERIGRALGNHFMANYHALQTCQVPSAPRGTSVPLEPSAAE